jgi:hypothetical protein
MSSAKAGIAIMAARSNEKKQPHDILPALAVNGLSLWRRAWPASATPPWAMLLRRCVPLADNDPLAES